MLTALLAFGGVLARYGLTSRNPQGPKHYHLLVVPEGSAAAAAATQRSVSRFKQTTERLSCVETPSAIGP